MALFGVFGGGVFFGTPGYPPSFGGGVQDSRFQGSVFGTPFGGSGFWALPKTASFKKRGFKRKRQKSIFGFC